MYTNSKEKKYNRADNLINNQNYIISTKIKKTLVLNYLLDNDSNFFFITIIIYINKKILSILLDITYIRKNTFLLFLLFHFLLIIICSPLLYFGSLFYIVLYLYISFTLVNTFYDYYLLDVDIVGFRVRNTNLLYINKLVSSIKIKGEILKNDGFSWLVTLLFSLISNTIFIFLLYLFKKYA